MLISRRHFASATAALGAGLALPSLAEATTARALNLSELAARSRRATVGVPVQHDSDWAWVAGARRIVTWTRIVQEDDLFEEEGSRDEILVLTLGGKVGDLRQKVPGEAALKLGEKALIFASHSNTSGVRRVVGMAQGHYPVDRDALVLQPSRNLPDLVPARPGNRPQGKKSAVEVLSGKSLSDARQLIRSVR